MNYLQAKESPINFNDPNRFKRTLSEIDTATLENINNPEPRVPTVADIESQKVTQMNMAINNKIHSFKMYLIPIISILFIGIIIMLVLLYLDNQNLKQQVDLFKQNILSINRNLINLAASTNVQLTGIE